MSAKKVQAIQLRHLITWMASCAFIFAVDDGHRPHVAHVSIPTRCQQRSADVQQLHAQGMRIHGIARTLQRARNTVRKYVRASCSPDAQRPTRHSSLTPYESYLWQRWQAGCHNATQLWDERKQQGFHGGISIMKDRVAPWRTRARATPRSPQRFTPRATMWLLRRPDAILQAHETAYVAALVARCPEIAVAHALTREMKSLLHARAGDALAGWLERARASTIREFKGVAVGIRRDQAAVAAALTVEWNNGPVEGYVNRLKLLQRQGYGRAGFDLLRQRVLHAPCLTKSVYQLFYTGVNTLQGRISPAATRHGSGARMIVEHDLDSLTTASSCGAHGGQDGVL